MGEERDRDERPDFEGYRQAVGVQIIQRIAEALRAEFGVGIDAHPGGEGNEAGVINQTLRAMARVILEGVVSPGDDPADVLTWVLRHAALRRLDESGMDGSRAEGLLELEPGLGDRWLAYLALAPASVLDDLLAGSTGE
jgi:hypothetical protein